jgi:hypothetical protein
VFRGRSRHGWRERGRRLGAAQFREDDADVAQAGEDAVELRLVDDLDGDSGGPVGLASQVERPEPG